MLKKGHIGHNKFVVYVKNGPKAVLSGSTNWTPTGLCAQSNNAIVIESPALATEYLAYWNNLKKDTKAAKGDGSALQAKQFRSSNAKARSAHELNAADGKPAGDIQVWFSPNTQQKSVPRSKKAGKAPPTPGDLGEVFELMENAKQGALFLAFIPGNPSIVTKLADSGPSRTVIPIHRGQRSCDCGQFPKIV
jgi:phosphatidylserine/phosphatidylglycerophosphate/cardiolipin synthase-like enzyme